MRQKQVAPVRARREDWAYEPGLEVGRRRLERGFRFTVRGERGAEFTFIELVRTESGTWINCLGGTPGVRAFRCFRPSGSRAC